MHSPQNFFSQKVQFPQNLNARFPQFPQNLNLFPYVCIIGKSEFILVHLFVDHNYVYQ